MFRKYNVLFIFLVLIFSISNNFSFATNTDKAKLQQTKIERKQVQQQLNQKKRQLNQVSSEINTLVSKIDSSEDKILDLNGQIRNLNINIEQTEKNIIKTKEEIEESEKILSERIKLMYKTSDISYIQIILESKNISELISNSYNVQKILNADKKLLEELSEKRKKLEEYNKNLSNEKQRISAAQDKVKIEKDLLESYKIKYQDAKKVLANDIIALNAREQQLKNESNALEQKILAAMRASGSANKPYTGGRFLWPISIKGTITSGYGNRISPISGRREFHLGVDIAAPRGTGVVAVANGTVITSRYQRSYGNVIQIDHGGGISTVYAHNSSLLVTAGQKVNKGQIIAKVGSTGDSTGNHLHFEVRINGKTVNPLGYIR